MATDERHEGWCSDPFGLHEARWMSGGVPTKLVRDGHVERYEQVPTGAPPFTCSPVAATHVVLDGADLHRSDAPVSTQRDDMHRAATTSTLIKSHT